MGRREERDVRGGAVASGREVTDRECVCVCCDSGGVPVSGQGFRLQERYFTRTPWQYLPPLEGIGLLQSRFDSCTPPPHVREHDPNKPHLPQRPSTY